MPFLYSKLSTAPRALRRETQPLIYHSRCSLASNCVPRRNKMDSGFPNIPASVVSPSLTQTTLQRWSEIGTPPLQASLSWTRRLSLRSFVFRWGNGQGRTRSPQHLPEPGPSAQPPPSELLGGEEWRQSRGPVGLCIDAPRRRRCPQHSGRPFAVCTKPPPASSWPVTSLPSPHTPTFRLAPRSKWAPRGRRKFFSRRFALPEMPPSWIFIG